MPVFVQDSLRIHRIHRIIKTLVIDAKKTY